MPSTTGSLPWGDAGIAATIGGGIPLCKYLAVASFEDIVRRSVARPDAPPTPTLIPNVARLRAAFSSSSAGSIRLHDALTACSDAAAFRYFHAHRPVRADFCRLLAEGLLSAARSGAIDNAVLASALAPVFDDPVDPDRVALVLEVLVGCISELSHFANPLLGHALCTAYQIFFSTVRRLDDVLLTDILSPAFLPLLAVAASCVFSPGTSVVAESIAPYVPTLQTISTCSRVCITTTYAPVLSTTVVLPCPTVTRIKLDRDLFNSFAALFLVPTETPVRALQLLRFHALPLKQRHPLHISGRSFRVEASVVRSLQQALDRHLDDPVHRSWTTFRAHQMGDL